MITEFVGGACMDCGGPCLIVVREADAAGVREVTSRPAVKIRGADGVLRPDWRGVCAACRARAS